jgi:hypothetical protein
MTENARTGSQLNREAVRCVPETYLEVPGKPGTRSVTECSNENSRHPAGRLLFLWINLRGTEGIENQTADAAQNEPHRKFRKEKSRPGSQSQRTEISTH